MNHIYKETYFTCLHNSSIQSLKRFMNYFKAMPFASADFDAISYTSQEILYKPLISKNLISLMEKENSVKTFFINIVSTSYT